ncbi:hypothetical protein P4S68_14360 [Pseudoalteromonas sp. Hal099]
MAGDKSFTALGTVFNVQRNTSSDLELVVTEGKVMITDPSVAVSANDFKDYQLADNNAKKYVKSMPILLSLAKKQL